MDATVLDEIVKAARTGGVTYDVSRSQTITELNEWCFPRWPDRTEIVEENRLKPALAVFLQRYATILQSEEVLLGIWKNDGRYYIDMNAHVAAFEDARRLAQRYSRESKRSIISAYNPATQETRYF